MSESWTDHIVGERMALDREFADRVVDSQFSNQEWSLIMTATTFEIERPADSDQAALVANTEQVEHVLAEFDSAASQPAGFGGTGRGDSSDSAGGLFDSIKSAFGLGSDDGGITDAERTAADRLAQEYASELQTKLESNGRWDEVRELAASM
ncbi:hypothetical protein C479_14558 [Halovivax asiaticus JCM 14624]|uniref:Uncharacterized protein n=1 Tax=Halovivax asiaticus JCM 14624 TaxID=1227490 RepID=M0BG13_9EURY|nr:DUF5799 family protein [Halovivax asiaticus]ELZ08569.1 hypothetical protein C479_14558 [Halovivax asiaticus JCM 14624]